MKKIILRIILVSIVIIYFSSSLFSNNLNIIFPDKLPIFNKFLYLKLTGIYSNNIIKSQILLIRIKTNLNIILKRNNTKNIKIDISTLSNGSYSLILTYRYKINNRIFQKVEKKYIIISHTDYSKTDKSKLIKDLFYYMFLPDGANISGYSEFHNFFNNLFQIGFRKKVKHPLFYYLNAIYNLQRQNLEATLNSLIYAIEEEKYYKNDDLLKKFKKIKIASVNKNYINGYLLPTINSYYPLLINKISIENIFSPEILEKLLKLNKLSQFYTYIITQSILNTQRIGEIFLYAYNGIILLKKDKIKEAKKVIENGIELYKKYDIDFSSIQSYYKKSPLNLLYMELAYLYYIENNLSKVIVYNKKISDNYIGKNFIMGFINYNNDEYEKAVKSFKVCLSEKGKSIFISKYKELSFEGEIYNMIGMCYFKKGYYQIALDKFLSAVSSPDSITAYKENLAICYQKLGKIEKTKEFLTELSDLPHLFLKAYLNSLKESITYKPLKGKPVVWVMPFTDIGGNVKRAGMSEYLQDIIMSELYKTKKFRVVEREKIKDIIKEKKLSISKFGDKKYLKNKQKIISADYLIGGNYMEMGKDIILSIKMISIKSGTIIKTKLYRVNNFSLLFKKIKEFIIKLK